jgi:hypothetical protein
MNESAPQLSVNIQGMGRERDLVKNAYGADVMPMLRSFVAALNAPSDPRICRTLYCQSASRYSMFAPLV